MKPVVNEVNPEHKDFLLLWKKLNDDINPSSGIKSKIHLEIDLKISAITDPICQSIVGQSENQTI